MDFSHYCSNNNLILAFLKFKLANKTFDNSDVHKSCQQKLLTAEIEGRRESLKNIKMTILNY